MSTPLDADQLRTFVAIAEAGGFTAAARATAKTQSAVSMQMKRLEDRLGLKLFAREGRRNALTCEGKRLLDYARRITRLNEEAVIALSAPELSGSIRLGLPDDYAERLLPPILASFARSHPKIEIDVHCMGSVRLTEKIAQGTIDLGIVTHADTGRTGEVLRREPLHWVGCCDHDIYDQDPLPLAIGPTTCSWRRAAIAALDSVDRNHRIAYVSSSATALCSAVAAGLAVTVLPESAFRADLAILEGFPTLPYCEISLLQRPDVADAGQRRMQDSLAQHIRDRLGGLASVPVPAPARMPAPAMVRSNVVCTAPLVLPDAAE